jgi:hypothetical protein
MESTPRPARRVLSAVFVGGAFCPTAATCAWARRVGQEPVRDLCWRTGRWGTVGRAGDDPLAKQHRLARDTLRDPSSLAAVRAQLRNVASARSSRSTTPRSRLTAQSILFTSGVRCNYVIHNNTHTQAIGLTESADSCQPRVPACRSDADLRCSGVGWVGPRGVRACQTPGGAAAFGTNRPRSACAACGKVMQPCATAALCKPTVPADPPSRPRSTVRQDLPLSPSPIPSHHES